MRQTLDPFVNDIQYIASREVLLERNGSLSISKIGLGNPGDEFFIVSREEQPPCPYPLFTVYKPSDILSPSGIRMMASNEPGPHPILTIVESGDHRSGFERHERRMQAWHRDQELAYLKGLVTRAWNWAIPVYPSIPSSSVTSTESQRRDSISIRTSDLGFGKAGSVSTCVADIGNVSTLVHRHRIAEVADSDS